MDIWLMQIIQLPSHYNSIELKKGILLDTFTNKKEAKRFKSNLSLFATTFVISLQVSYTDPKG